MIFDLQNYEKKTGELWSPEKWEIIERFGKRVSIDYQLYKLFYKTKFGKYQEAKKRFYISEITLLNSSSGIASRAFRPDLRL